MTPLSASCGEAAVAGIPDRPHAEIADFDASRADGGNARFTTGRASRHPVRRRSRRGNLTDVDDLFQLRVAVHYNKRWDIAAANHVAHGNAAARAPESQYACGSNASRVADMADEIVCFPLDANRNADGSLDVLVVGQVMTDLDAAGGQGLGGDDYEQLPKGNLDVTGRYFIWTTNLGGDRLDALIPAERLIGTASGSGALSRRGAGAGRGRLPAPARRAWER